MGKAFCGVLRTGKVFFRTQKTKCNKENVKRNAGGCAGNAGNGVLGDV